MLAGTPNATGVVSIVAAKPGANGYLQVLPCGSTPGTSSNLNYAAGLEAIATLAFVRFDATGRACVYNQTATDVVADLQGYMNAGAFDDVTDTRLVDTRATARPGNGGSTVLTGRANATGIVSIVATKPSADGYLQVLACGSTPGASSNLNYTRGVEAIATLAFVRFDAAGTACIYNLTATDVVADLQGYMNTGAFDDVTDVRLVDTRAAARPGNGGSTALTGRANATGIVSIVATKPSADGYLQVLPCGTAPGASSNLNYAAGVEAIATLAFVRFDAAGHACISNFTSTDVVADLQGYMNTGAFDDVTDQRIVDTRTTAKAKVAIAQVLSGFEYRPDPFPLSTAFVSVPAVPLTFTALDRSTNNGPKVCNVDGAGNLNVAITIPFVPFVCEITTTAAPTATTEGATATYLFSINHISIAAAVIGTPTKVNLNDGTYQVDFVIAFTPARPSSVRDDSTCVSTSFVATYDAVAKRFSISTHVAVPVGGCKVVVSNNPNDQFSGSASVTLDVP